MPDSNAPYARHFGGLAVRYDSLRKDPSDENIAALVRAGDLQGRTVLDVGCGTGRVATVLATSYQARVFAVDRSLAMLGVAGSRAANLAGRAGACAESLPFGDATFERALLQMVVHLVDRRCTFAELHRVLTPGGCLVVCTLDPAGVEHVWLSRFFPSYAGIDRQRFPAPERLMKEAREAGFSGLHSVPFVEHVAYRREQALQLLRERYASSFALIGEAEYQDGLRRAERELGDCIEFPLALAIVTAVV